MATDRDETNDSESAPIDSSVNGAEPSDHDAEHAACVQAQAPEAAPAHIQELADGCVRFVATRYGATLDFTSDTLSLLDQWARDARSEAAERPDVARIVETAGGAYLGEVIRRAFGGYWRICDDEADWRLLLSAAYCSFNPVAMVREAIWLKPADGWHGHVEVDPADREAIEARLAALPEVADDEFYAPSTRFDVVELVVHALCAAQSSSGHGDVHFEPDDYT